MLFYVHVACDKHKMKFTRPVFVFKFKTFSEMCVEFLWVKSETFLFYTICEISVKKQCKLWFNLMGSIVVAREISFFW